MKGVKRHIDLVKKWKTNEESLKKKNTLEIQSSRTVSRRIIAIICLQKFCAA